MHRTSPSIPISNQSRVRPSRAARARSNCGSRCPARIKKHFARGATEKTARRQPGANRLAWAVKVHAARAGGLACPEIGAAIAVWKDRVLSPSNNDLRTRSSRMPTRAIERAEDTAGVRREASSDGLDLGPRFAWQRKRSPAEWIATPGLQQASCCTSPAAVEGVASRPIRVTTTKNPASTRTTRARPSCGPPAVSALTAVSRTGRCPDAELRPNIAAEGWLRGRCRYVGDGSAAVRQIGRDVLHIEGWRRHRRLCSNHPGGRQVVVEDARLLAAFASSPEALIIEEGVVMGANVTSPESTPIIESRAARRSPSRPLCRPAVGRPWHQAQESTRHGASGGLRSDRGYGTAPRSQKSLNRFSVNFEGEH